MYTINKNKTQILNLEQITAIYIGADDVSIKATFATGTGCQVEKYDSHTEAAMALEMLGKAIGRNEVFFFPDNQELKAKIQEGRQMTHHITGKKTKGHGGS